MLSRRALCSRLQLFVIRTSSVYSVSACTGYRSPQAVGRRSLSTRASLPDIPIFKTIASHDPQSIAVVHSASQRTFTYGSLLRDVIAAKEQLQNVAGGAEGSLGGERVAFLAEHGYDYVVRLLSILAHDAIALPLSLSFPASETRYIMNNSRAAVLLTTRVFEDKAREILSEGLEVTPKFGVTEKIDAGADGTEDIQINQTSQGMGGLMLYTSGTTNRPKGVLLKSAVLESQAESLIKAWAYSTKDRLLHVLPLHHIHGTINALLTPLMAGSKIEFLYPFNPTTVWQRLAAPFQSKPSLDPVTFFTAVPTMYARLLAEFVRLPEDLQITARKGIAPEHLRLNVSGSAALPTSIKSSWTNLSNGNVLLERYGMTEVGMALSCGLDPADRIDGSVGWPLPGVEARLVDAESDQVIPIGSEVDSEGRIREGEIQLRGPTVFTEYWNNPQATATEFVEDVDGKGKWFKTGDIASRQTVPGTGKSNKAWAKGPMYFIRGRKSVDIIKTGGEKVSALEIERELLSLPQVAEAAVVGVNSKQWGQKVAAVVVLHESQKLAGRGGKQWGVMDMRRALKDRLVNYKLPQEMKVVEAIPRNAMGKINKKLLLSELFP